MLVLLSAASTEQVYGADDGEPEWSHGDSSQAGCKWCRT